LVDVVFVLAYFRGPSQIGAGLDVVVKKSVIS
jgi:hypothetical protein